MILKKLHMYLHVRYLIILRFWKFTADYFKILVFLIQSMYLISRRQSKNLTQEISQLIELSLFGNHWNGSWTITRIETEMFHVEDGIIETDVEVDTADIFSGEEHMCPSLSDCYHN